MPKPKITRRPGLSEIIGLGRTWITDTLNPESPRYDSTFPKPFKFQGSQTNFWVVDEAYAWVEAQIAKGRSGESK